MIFLSCGIILVNTSLKHRLASLGVGIYTVAHSLALPRLSSKFSHDIFYFFKLRKILINLPFCETLRLLIFTWVMVVFFVGMCFLLPAYYGNDALIGNRIVSGLTEWIASEQSPSSQNKSYEKSAFTKRFHCVFGAGWCEPAAGRKEGRYKLFV